VVCASHVPKMCFKREGVKKMFSNMFIILFVTLYHIITIYVA
jgi:hypothetical protein